VQSPKRNPLRATDASVPMTTHAKPSGATTIHAPAEYTYSNTRQTSITQPLSSTTIHEAPTRTSRRSIRGRPRGVVSCTTRTLCGPVYSIQPPAVQERLGSPGALS
jgi:hypothetical protein